MGQTIAITVGHGSLLCLPKEGERQPNLSKTSISSGSSISRHNGKNKLVLPSKCFFRSSRCLVLNKNSHDDPIEGCRGEWHPLPDTLATFLPAHLSRRPPAHATTPNSKGMEEGETPVPNSTQYPRPLPLERATQFDAPSLSPSSARPAVAAVLHHC